MVSWIQSEHLLNYSSIFRDFGTERMGREKDFSKKSSLSQGIINLKIKNTLRVAHKENSLKNSSKRSYSKSEGGTDPVTAN